MRQLILAILATVFLVSGCVSLHDLSTEITKAKETGKEGVVKVYPVDINQAWEISRAVFRWEKTDEIEEHRNENYMITSTGLKMVAFGSAMGVWIEPADFNQARITVITRRRVLSDTFTRLTESKFYERFDQGVIILKSGKKLPDFLH